MRSIARLVLTVLLLAGGLGSLAQAQPSSRHYDDDDDMSYARVTRVEPVYQEIYRSVSCRPMDDDFVGGYDYSHRGGIGRHYRDYDGPGFGYRGYASCEPTIDRVYGGEVIAYRVYYRYHGHDLVREMAYDPGPQLKIHTDSERDN